MHSSGYPDGRSCSVSCQPFSRIFHGNLTCFPSSAQGRCPAYRSFRLSQGLQEYVGGHFIKSSKEPRSRQGVHKHALEQLHGVTTERTLHSEGIIQLWTCQNFTFNQNTNSKKGNACAIRGNFLPTLVPSSHGKIFDKMLRSFFWPEWSIDSGRCGHSAILSIFLSLLMSLSPFCLNGAPAFAHEIFHEETMSNNTMMDVLKMEEGNPETQGAAGAIGLANEYEFVTRATPLFRVSDSALVCEEAYGLFPCSNSLIGNLFLMLVYGYLLLTAAKLISDGSELLLEVMNPGLIGGLLLPILGALPDAALICASGIGGTVEEDHWLWGAVTYPDLNIQPKISH